MQLLYSLYINVAYIVPKRHMSTPHTAMINDASSTWLWSTIHRIGSMCYVGKETLQGEFLAGNLGVAITIMLLEHYSHCRCTRPILLLMCIPPFHLCTIGLGPFLGILLRLPLFSSFSFFLFSSLFLSATQLTTTFHSLLIQHHYF